MTESEKVNVYVYLIGGPGDGRSLFVSEGMSHVRWGEEKGDVLVIHHYEVREYRGATVSPESSHFFGKHSSLSDDEMMDRVTKVLRPNS